MKVRDLIIDEHNRWKLAGRASEDEVREVAFAKSHPTWHDADESGPPLRCLLLGCTSAGRVLRVVTEPMGGGVHRLVTTWGASEKDIRRYLAWRRTVRK